MPGSFLYPSETTGDVGAAIHEANLFLDHAVFEEILQFGHEFLHILEIHVDASEADVGHFVELFQPMHDHFADLRGGQFPLGGVVHHAFDFIHDGLKLRCGHGSFFAGLQQALQDLLPLKTFAAAVFLDHHVGNFIDAFVCGEAAGAFETFAAPADGVAGTAFAGVDYLIVKMRAERALHSLGSPLVLGAYYRNCRSEIRYQKTGLVSQEGLTEGSPISASISEFSCSRMRFSSP